MKAKHLFPAAFAACMLCLNGTCIDKVEAAMQPFDFTEYISYHNSILLFEFSLDSPAAVTMFSTSWNEESGFDPYMTLWYGDGRFLDSNDNTSGSNRDVYYSTWGALEAGTYIISITAAYNQPLAEIYYGATLADGFEYDGQAPVPIEVWAGGRSGWLNFHIENVSTAVSLNSPQTAVPEPGSLILMGAGLTALALTGRRRACAGQAA